MLRNNVTVKEQEYLLQNVTSEPVTFVVEHVLPDDWTVDSDPQPVKIVDNKAFFSECMLSLVRSCGCMWASTTQIPLPTPIEPARQSLKQHQARRSKPHVAGKV
jgi:hypothetical protein